LVVLVDVVARKDVLVGLGFVGLLVGGVATGEVVNFVKAVLGKDAAGEIAAMAGAAEDNDLLSPGNLCQSAAQLVHRQIDGSFDAAQAKFHGSARVDQDGVGGVQLLQFVPVDYLANSGEDVFRHHAGQVHGILGAGKRRSVGVFELHQVVHGLFVLDDVG